MRAKREEREEERGVRRGGEEVRGERRGSKAQNLAVYEITMTFYICRFNIFWSF